ncbi:Hypothetical predicted protein [Pelobates cultripes]|uniref:Uncharacterized protein n=1 Tax=Pelobates cultripes TaxID=61616 RepID=A0AAD1SEH1_PELCU|nr:Hypothetical predicted protein [Pelobates cultripes]
MAAVWQLQTGVNDVGAGTTGRHGEPISNTICTLGWGNQDVRLLLQLTSSMHFPDPQAALVSTNITLAPQSHAGPMAQSELREYASAQKLCRSRPSLSCDFKVPMLCCNLH